MRGLNSPGAPDLSYTIPQGCTAGVRYVRAGSTVEGMLNISPPLQNGKATRYVPVVAASTTHVPLAIVDKLEPGTEVTIAVAAQGA